MRLIFTSILFLSMVFFLVFLRDKKDFFSPRNLLPIIYIVKLIPCMAYISVTGVPETISQYTIHQAINSDSAFYKYGFLQMFSFIGMMIVVNYLCIKNEKVESEQCENNKYLRIKHKRWSIVFLLIGLSGFILNIQAMGGIVYFLNNLQYRTILLRDQDVLSWISSIIVYGPLLLIYSKKYMSSNKEITIYEWAFIVLIGLVHGMGGRKSVLLLLLQVVILYHYCIKRVQISKILNIKMIVIVSVVLIMFTLLPTLRVEGQFDYLLANPKEVLSDAIDNISGLFVKESYVPFYIGVVYLMDKGALWYGKSFLGILTAFIPSSLYPLKPPVDDGMYLYSMSLGRTDIIPPMTTKDLNISSYPLETFGSMYANFGELAVILGMIILGVIVVQTYNVMKKKKYSFFWIITYINILIGFELSTLRIVQVIISIILTGMVSICVRRIKI